jgi:hypothetical protein
MRTLAVVFLALLVPISPAVAQIPDEFTNLKVLPKDISRDEMVSVMRRFSTSLGVRCKFCHVGESEDSLEGYDFASDEPKHKQVARGMMAMTGEINGKLLPGTGLDSPMRVECVTCHRGLAEPRGLQEVLTDVIEKDGVSAAADRYRALRKKYFGSGAYDFGPATLNAIAEKLAREEQDVKGALILMKLNVETNSDSVETLLMLAQLFMASDEKDKALLSVRRALDLEPENEFGLRMLQRLSPSE